MKCKDCWIYKQRFEQTIGRRQNLLEDTCRWLKKRLLTEEEFENLVRGVAEVRDYLEKQWRWLVIEIRDQDCPEGRCIL